MTQASSALRLDEIAAAPQTRSHRSLVALLADAYARHATLTAYRYMGRSFTYEQIDNSARALAAWWAGQGIKRGDRVAVMLPNVPQYPIAVAAILRAGAVVVNIDPLLSGKDLELRLKDAGAKSLVLCEHFAAAVQSVLPRLPNLPTRKIIIASLGDMLGPLRGSLVNYVERSARHAVAPFELPQAVRFNDALAQGQAIPLSAIPVQHDDLAVLQYTAGSSTQDRAAVLLHRNLVASVEQAAHWLAPALGGASEPTAQTVVSCALPLHTPFGFNLGTLLAPALGLCCVLNPHLEEAAGLAKEVTDEHVNSLWASPQRLQQLAEQAQASAVAWTSLRLCLSVGGSLSPATSAFWQTLTRRQVGEVYGRAEAGPFIAGRLQSVDPEASARLQPLPGTEAVALGPDDQLLPPGVIGDLAVRGPQVMAGYWQRPDETARVMTAKGFMRTGDLAETDAQGDLRIIDKPCDRATAPGSTCLPPMPSRMRWA